MLQHFNFVITQNGRRNSAVSSAAPPSLRPGPASSSTSLPALKAPSINDSVKEEISITSSHAEEYSARHESINRKNLPDQKTLKVRIKVGSDNLSTQKNAAIYSGLGLDVSPSSSLDGSPSESEGMDCEPQDAPFESPTNIIRVNYPPAVSQYFIFFISMCLKNQIWLFFLCGGAGHDFLSSA